MNKIIFALLVLAISLVAIANAVSDNVIVGPYSVSFDVGQRGVDYTSDILTPEHTETLSGEKQTLYKIILTNSTTKKLVNIFIRVIDTQPVTYNIAQNVPEKITYVGSTKLINHGFANRTIDKNQGQVISDYSEYLLSDLYTASYQIPSENNTLVTIQSNWPWSPETTNLLNTIHVERVK